MPPTAENNTLPPTAEDNNLPPTTEDNSLFLARNRVLQEALPSSVTYFGLEYSRHLTERPIVEKHIYHIAPGPTAATVADFRRRRATIRKRISRMNVATRQREHQHYRTRTANALASESTPNREDRLAAQQEQVSSSRLRQAERTSERRSGRTF